MADEKGIEITKEEAEKLVSTLVSKSYSRGSTMRVDAGVLTAMSAQREELKAAMATGTPVAPSVTVLREGFTAPVVAPAGMVPFKDIFGFDPPSGRSRFVYHFKPEDWDEAVRPLIPPIDAGYVFPPDETEAVVLAVVNGETAFAHGPKGSGKSSLFAQVCARMNIPFIRVNCRQDMESGAIFGQISANPTEGITWCPGPIEVLGIHGGMLCIDELSAAPPGINMALQWPLERGGNIYLADKPVPAQEKVLVPHKMFRIVATDNTELQGDTSGKYAGTMVQNEALADRFATTVKVDYMSADHETKMIKSQCPHLTSEIIKKMIALARHVRGGVQTGDIQFTFSPRTLVNWGNKMKDWDDPIMAFRLAFFNKLTEDDRKRVSTLVEKVFAVSC
jgi:cobaltochelatase CobS